MTHTCAWGVFTIPPEVAARAQRMQAYGRHGYIDQWCRYQRERHQGWTYKGSK